MSGGLSPGDKGLIYQKRWTLYLALLAYRSGRNFVLGFELPDAKAGKFDDIFLKIDGSLHFIQVKHSSTPKKVTKIQFTEQKGSWSLAKYNNAWPKFADPENDLTGGSDADVYCILLTNASLDDSCGDYFKAISSKLEWMDFINSNSYFQSKSKDKFLRLSENYKQFECLAQLDTNFVNHFLLMTAQPSLEELSDRIVNILKKEFGENAENAFYMIEYELTRMFHKENKDAILRNREWLEELFKTCREKNYLKFFNNTFEDIVPRYVSVINTHRAELAEGTIAFLPYETSHHLRMIQAKQMVGMDDFWYVPLESLEQRGDLKESVVQALTRCETSRALILLDSAEHEGFVGDILEKLSKKIKKVVVITNHHDTRKHLRNNLNATWKIQKDAKKISLRDLEGCDEYGSYEIMFQGIAVQLRKLPSAEMFMSELSEDALIALIRKKTLSIGNCLSDSEFKNNHYEPRKLALIAFEIEGLILEDFKPVCRGEYFAHKCGVEQNQPFAKEAVVHVVDSTVDDKWKWCYTLPKCSDVIPAISRSELSSDERSELEDETAKNISKVFKTVLNKVRLGQGSSDTAIDEQQFLNLLNVEGHEKMVIIGGETGAGKSTTLRRLAQLHKEMFPEKWIIFINLCGNRFVENDRVTEEITTEWIRQFLLEEINDKGQPFVERYFESCSPSEVIVYLDSFDEICATHLKKAFDITRKLIEINVYRIVISSRQYQEFLLFNEWPKSKIYHLVPLSFEEQLKMLRRILQSEGKPLLGETVQMLQNLQGQLGNEAIFNAKAKLGASQVVHMLAQIVKDNTERTFAATRFTIFDLYEKYINCFIKKVGLEKFKLDTQSSNVNQADFEGRKRDFYETLGILSMQKKFSANVFKQVVRTTIREDFDKQHPEYSSMNGLVYPNLKHRSYEDFFFARAMHVEFIDVEFDKFWKFFKNSFTENGLVRLFFFHRVSNRFQFYGQNVAMVDDDEVGFDKEDEAEYKNKFLNLIEKINDEERTYLTEEERSLPGIQKALDDAISQGNR